MVFVKGEWSKKETFWHPRQVKARLEIAEKYLRLARQDFGAVGVRLQFQIRAFKGHKSVWRYLRGESVIVTVDEPVDVWDLWADLKRFLKAWRPWRTRTTAGEQKARQALELWEAASRDLKP